MSRLSETRGDNTGPWSIEPVHDAIVAQRMAELQSGLHAAREGAARTRELPGGAKLRAVSGSRAVGSVGVAGRPRRLVRGVRARVGHALVSFGGMVEGRRDPADGSAARTA